MVELGQPAARWLAGTELLLQQLIDVEAAQQLDAVADHYRIDTKTIVVSTAFAVVDDVVDVVVVVGVVE